MTGNYGQGVPVRLLLVEDSENDAMLLLRELRRGGYEPSHERVYTPEGMERALEEAEARGEPYEVVISDYYMPRFVKDAEGRYTLVNRRFEDLFTTTKDRVLGRTDHDFFPRESADAFRVNDLEVLRSEAPLEAEETISQEDGVHTYFSVKFPLKDPDGIPYATCGISTDITRRKETEERAAFLADLDRTLQPITDPDEVMATAARMLGEHVGADRCAYAEVEADEDHFRITGDYTRDVPSIVGRFSMTQFGSEALRLGEIREAERNRIARELHDSILQGIVYALQEIQILQVMGHDGDGGRALGDAADALRRSVEGLRGAIFELRLEQTLENSIVESLENLVDLNRRMAREAYEIELVVGEDVPSVLPAGAREIVRVVQEALTNVRRHSGAGHARVEVGVEGEALYAEVRDDGRGFDVGLSRTGVGRHSMRQRALELGGEVEVRSEPGRGTRVLCRVPLPRPDGGISPENGISGTKEQSKDRKTAI